MRIALLGGTGDIGEGLTLRFARDTDHELLVGSRDPEKARDAVDDYKAELDSHAVDDPDINGFGNEMAADRADVAILSVPPYYAGDTVDAIDGVLDADTVLVTPAVGMKGDEDGMHYHPPGAGSVTELVAQRASDGVPVVGAFHNLAAGKLADLSAEFDLDTLLVGDDDSAKETVRALANEIDGLRALDAGPLANAAEVESVTPLVINIAKHNDELHDVGVKWV
ncbi:NADPH-dependent F420 reductase [Natrialba aegyptia]|uniref:NADPH-dependent F420 reductase n=1 Tax=Natrialba aegyptia DSM 13077 TaxID=1227491 RepID=M0BPC8_9EURY|nr:NADPH-dependent F420 reductase [Natrialba aegyptia]ELZ11479.1 NADPH-dependent F420 reductase [Natrialba aegyptia DSM 13077]